MFFDKRSAAWVTAYLMADGPVHDVAQRIAQRIDPESALFVVKCVTTFGSYALGEHAPAIKEVLEAVHESQALEPVLFQEEVALGLERAEPVEAEQVKAEQVKADAELAAAAIEEQTQVVEKQISDEAGKSAAEVDALKKDFEREQQELTGKLDGMARNYFDKHPDLSEDQRRDATETFKGIKEEALGDLRTQQETRLGELTRAQQEQRETLVEKRKELEDTRDGRS